MNGPVRDLRAEDFAASFVAEPEPVDPEADLARGRRGRRRRVVGGMAVGVSTLTLVGVATGVVLGGAAPTAVPVAPPTSAVPSTVPVPSTGPAPTTSDYRLAVPDDTAPTLGRDARGSYLDADGLSLGRSGGPDVSPFHRTTKRSWVVAVRHLDPQRRHLGAYEEFAFTGGAAAGGAIQIGQKLGWTVKGEKGQGMVQLAVTRPLPGHRPVTGSGVDGMGQCADLEGADRCGRTTLAGRTVYLAETSDGFVMDEVQPDGEVASITVSAVFANNTTVPVSAVEITRTAAATLLGDPELDVVG